MCIAILALPGAIVPRSDMAESWRMNDDGAGLMFAHDGKLYIHKGYMDYNSFEALYYKLQKEYPASVFVLHFRIASAGRVSQDNTHPFLINDTLGMVHNGTFSFCSTTITDEMSDTRNFCENFLRHLPQGFLEMPVVLKAIDSLMGYSNKAIFLNSAGEYCIMNEAQGDWNLEKTIWYSNKSYKVYTSTQSNTLFHNHHGDYRFSRHEPYASSVGVRGQDTCWRCNCALAKSECDDKDTKYYCYRCFDTVRAKRKEGLELCTKCNFQFTPATLSKDDPPICYDCDAKIRSGTVDSTGLKWSGAGRPTYKRKATDKWITVSVGGAQSCQCFKCHNLYYTTHENAGKLCGTCSEIFHRTYKTKKYCELCHEAFPSGRHFKECTKCRDAIVAGTTAYTLGMEHKQNRFGKHGFGLRGYECRICYAAGGGGSGEDYRFPIDLRTTLCLGCFNEAETV